MIVIRAVELEVSFYIPFTQLQAEALAGCTQEWSGNYLHNYIQKDDRVEAKTGDWDGFRMAAY